MRDWLWDIASGGLRRDHDLEETRKTLLLNLIIIVGGFFLVFFTITAFLQQHIFLSVVNFGVVVFLIAAFLYLRKSKNYSLVGTVCVVAIGCFYSFLIGNGGVGNTAYVWSFTYPLISLFLTGAVLGSITTFSLLGVASVLFALGPRVAFLASYAPNLIIRFVAAYITVYLIALVMERVRAMVESRLGESNRRLEESVELLGKANEEKQTLIEDLRRSMDEVSTLKGILPICASCKMIRNDSGYWEQVEEYVRDRSQAEFSHALCPECIGKLYPEMDTNS